MYVSDWSENEIWHLYRRLTDLFGHSDVQNNEVKVVYLRKGCLSGN